jgi:uncharacterized protein (DUF4415 family)
MKSFELSRHGVRTERKNIDMKKNVKRIVHGKPLTPAHRREIATLSAKPDGEIDYSDMPQLTDNFFKNAVRNPFYRPVKRQLTVRLDADVVAWLRSQGKGYQTRLNQLLRAAMLERVVSK